MQSIGDLQLNIVLNLQDFNNLSAVLNALKLFSKQGQEFLKLDPKINIGAPVADLSKLSERAKDAASSVDSASKFLNASSGQLVSFKNRVQDSGFAIEGLRNIFSALKSTVGDAIKAYQDFSNAQLGLQSIASFKGIDPGIANNTITNLDLVKNGLLSVSDAATSIKNLLAANFTLEQSVEVLKRLGDSAAFARQGSLSFGEAVRGSTEGIKNGNSILVDNAGVTKNLSVMLQEAGYSAQDMMNAGSDAGVRMAIFNGIMRETTGQLGDANKLINSEQGAFVKFDKELNDIKISAGAMLSAFSPMITLFGKSINILNSFPQPIRDTVVAVTSVAVAIKLLNGSMPAPIKAFSLMLALMQMFPAPVKIVAGALTLLAAALVAVDMKLKATAVSAAFASGGLTVILGAIAAGGLLIAQGIGEASKSVDEYKSKVDSIKSSIEDYNTKISETKSHISDLEAVQSQLANNTALSNAEHTQYEATLGRISAVFPSIMSNVDQYTGKLSENKDVVENLISSEKEKLQIQQDARNAQIVKGISDTVNQYKDQLQVINQLKKEQTELNDAIAKGGRTTTVTSRQGFTSTTFESVEELRVKLTEVDGTLGDMSGIQATVTKNFDDFINTAAKTDDINKLVMQLKYNLGLASAASFNFFNQLSQQTGTAVYNWNQVANAIDLVKKKMQTTAGPEDTRPTISKLEKQKTDIDTKFKNEPVESVRKDLKKQSDDIQKEIDKMSFKTSAPKVSRSSHSTSKQEKDEVEEQIKSWEKLINIYYTADEFQSALSESGLSFSDVLSEINDKIKSQTNLTDDQVLSLVKYRDTILDAMEESGLAYKKLFAQGSPDDNDPDKLAKQFAQERMDWYNEYGSKDKRYKPLDETTEYINALKLIKELNKEKLTEADYEKFIISLKEKSNSIDLNSEKNLKLKIQLQNEIKENEKAILEIQKSQFDTFADLVQARVENIDDEFTRRNTMLDLEFAKEMKNLDEKRKAAKSEKEAENIDALKIEREKKLKKDHDALSKEQDEKQTQLLEDSFSKLMNHAQTISRIFGKAGESVANAFQKALEYTQIIKAVMESISLIKTIINLFSSAASTAAAAAPIFHDGGILSGASGADIPIIAQEGEGIISRPRMQQLSAAFGPGFFNFLNGRAALNRLGIFHSGGIVSAPARVPYQIVQVPFISETEIKGSNLKLTLARQNKMDARRTKS